jgi:hypothetical protein
MLLSTVTSVSGHTLNITRISRSHMGIYNCIANNGVPPAANQTFNVEVHCKYCFIKNTVTITIITTTTTTTTIIIRLSSWTVKITGFKIFPSTCLLDILGIFTLY